MWRRVAFQCSVTVSYAHSPGGMTVDLTRIGPQATENSQDTAGDTLESIVNPRGVPTSTR